MKIIANNYEAKDVIKIVREWTDLTQKQFGESIYMSEHGIQGYELGTRRCPLEVLIKVANEHGFTITIEGKEKK